MPTSRPTLLALTIGVALLAAACGSSTPSATGPTQVGPTATSSVAPAATFGADIDCAAPATPTIAQTEGPYYSAGAPESADLVPDGMPGTRLTLTGYVVDTGCTPIAGARVETWQADATGTYDNEGYILRGWVTTDAQGRFTIRTIVPGEYPGRTEHIHVKVTPPGGATLTSQLYFPGSTADGEDGIYDPSLDLVITEDGDAMVGTYTFVLES